MKGQFTTVIPDVEFWKQQVPCQMGCPVHTDAGRYVQLIAEKEFQKAYLTARSPNPFASVCGRVCAAPCEDVCRRGKLDAPVSIRALKRFVAEKFGVESLQPDVQNSLFEGGLEDGNKWPWHLPIQVTEGRARTAGRKVAVVGSGPAGLSCAHDLALMGYDVTVFEATNRAGGMLCHGIPEYRLPRSLIQKEVEKISFLGVKIRYNSPLTASFGLSDLRTEGFESFFISVGTQKGRNLSIEGTDLDGVVKAVDYLLNINSGYRIDLGKRVLVIGGGFVAFDAARMALRGGLDQEAPTLHEAVDAARSAVRSGASEVHIASLESFSEMPVLRTAQGMEEFEEARREGILFHPQRGPRRFIGREGRIFAVEFVGVSKTYDPDGRFNPLYDDNVREQVEIDSVILAVGQQTDLSFLRPDDGIEVTGGNFIRIDGKTLATTAPGIFAGGDVAFGPRNIIDAVANGKQAALSIDTFLHGKSPAMSFTLSVRKIPTSRFRRPEDFEQFAREAPPTIDLNRRTGISEVELTYDEEQAIRQAERCLSCHIQTIYNAERCVLCNRCVDVCPEFCLKLVPFESLNLDQSTRDRVAEHYHLDTLTPAAAMIKDEDTCIRCGLCAVRCPTDAMTMELFYYEEGEVIG